ncbi:class F sortase [Candidatus Nephthysia bennettiae]|uniref:class F sortase n=1 Tax=Candidatus Nephthysia bennettiae TaxID=3127016 RepID=UPI0030C75A6A
MYLDLGHATLRILIGAALAALAAIGGHVGVAGRGGHSLPASSQTSAAVAAAPGVLQAGLAWPVGGAGGGGLLSASLPPSRIKIARIRLDAPVSSLDAETGLAGPADPSSAGWFAQGPAPGDPGPAVVIGHLDSNRGPAVFWRLDQVRVGDEIVVSRSDGSLVRFGVRRLARYSRSSFPSSEVFGTRPGPELRLITCSGRFNFLTRQYTDNLVVYATS